MSSNLFWWTLWILNQKNKHEEGTSRKLINRRGQRVHKNQKKHNFSVYSSKIESENSYSPNSPEILVVHEQYFYQRWHNSNSEIVIGIGIDPFSSLMESEWESKRPFTFQLKSEMESTLPGIRIEPTWLRIGIGDIILCWNRNWNLTTVSRIGIGIFPSILLTARRACSLHTDSSLSNFFPLI